MQQPPYPMPPEQPPSYAGYPPYQGQPQPGYPPYQGQPQPGYPPYQGQLQPGYPVNPYQPGYSPYPPQPQDARKIALNYGLSFGAILAGVSILQLFIPRILGPSLLFQYHISLALRSISLAAVFAVVYWIIYFLAGLLTARRAQGAGTAITACLWASLCYFVVYCLLVVINVVLSPSVVRSFLRYYFTSIGIGVAIVLVVNIGLGIGIGALGGLIGKNLARR